MPTFERGVATKKTAMRQKGPTRRKKAASKVEEMPNNTMIMRIAV
jgi:hypothetical protein